jgi:rod shape-determining protein MreD
MRYIWIGIATIISYFLEVSFLGAARLLGVVPSILLVLLVVVSAALDPAELVALAALMGMLLDLSSGADFGLQTVFYVAASLGILVTRRVGTDSERWFSSILLVSGMVLGHGVVVAVAVATISGGSSLSLGLLASQAVSEVLLCIAYLIIIRPLVAFLRRDSSSLSIQRRSMRRAGG